MITIHKQCINPTLVSAGDSGRWRCTHTLLQIPIEAVQLCDHLVVALALIEVGQAYIPFNLHSYILHIQGIFTAGPFPYHKNMPQAGFEPGSKQRSCYLNLQY